MNLENLGRNINLFCPKCRSSQFKTEDTSVLNTDVVTCASCGFETTKDDLIQLNEKNISKHVIEIGDQAAQEIAKELKKSLQKAFGGSKHFKIK